MNWNTYSNVQNKRQLKLLCMHKNSITPKSCGKRKHFKQLPERVCHQQNYTYQFSTVLNKKVSHILCIIKWSLLIMYLELHVKWKHDPIKSLNKYAQNIGYCLFFLKKWKIHINNEKLYTHCPQTKHFPLQKNKSL